MKNSNFQRTLSTYMFAAALIYGDICQRIVRYRHKRKIKRIMQDKKIAELVKLAGIKDSNINVKD